MRRTHLLALTVASVALLIMPAAAQTEEAPTPLLLLGRVIDGTGSSAIDDGAVLILGSKILAVGARETVAAPENVSIIDVGDGTILPGLINAHVHASCTPSAREAWARAGVTTVRDVGLPLEYNWTHCLTESNQNPQEAHVLWAGPIVTAIEGYPVCGQHFPSLYVSSVEEARGDIGRLVGQGVDVIKIACLTGGMCPTLSVAEMTAIAETAHALGIPVTAHIDTPADIQLPMQAGVDDAAHTPTSRMTDQLVARMIQAGMGMVSTLAVCSNYDTSAPDNFVRFIRAGGVGAFGDDSGYLGAPGMPMEELLCLSDAGLSAMEVIVVATRNSARVGHVSDSLGTLEPGKQADILIVAGNPLADLEALRSPLLVIHEGTTIVDNRESSS
jgi:imidazolonepropionase-like amidohydrolase